MPRSATQIQLLPYMSYGVFIKSIETLAETTVPTGPLDRRVFSTFSGFDYSTLVTGLQFLGLIDEQRKATATYRELVKLWKDGESKEATDYLLGIVNAAYKPFIGNVNLEHGTIAELEKTFKESGASSGQMLTKSIRFYLKVLGECGFKLSPHITARKPRAQNTAKKNSTEKKSPSAQKERANEGIRDSPEGFEILSLPGMPNSFIQYPVNLTEAQCDVLEGMITVLRTSIKARTGGKGKQT